MSPLRYRHPYQTLPLFRKAKPPSELVVEGLLWLRQSSDQTLLTCGHIGLRLLT